MNGRIFDPVLARFLSADPNIDGVSDSQGYNRYSYVHNNPLNEIDPSGYLSLKEIGVIVAVVVAAVVTAGAAIAGAATAGVGVTASGAAAVTGFGSALGAIAGGSLSLTGAIIAGAAGGFASGFAGSLLNGGSIGDAFKAGVIGAAVGGVSAGLAHGIGTLASKYDWFNNMKWAAHGLAQGLVTEAAGGEFRHGFYAGFVTSAAAGPIGQVGDQFGAVGEIAAAAVIGGTASAIGGGKFANGAISGAFTHLFNDMQHDRDEALLRSVNAVHANEGRHFNTIEEYNAWVDANSTQQSLWAAAGQGAAMGAAVVVDQVVPFADPMKNVYAADANKGYIKASQCSAAIGVGAAETALGIRGAAWLGKIGNGTRWGHWINHNRVARIGPGNVPKPKSWW